MHRHMIVGTVFLTLSLGTAFHAWAGDHVDVRKLSLAEKRRIIDQAKKQGPDGIAAKMTVLLEIYAADLFDREAHDNSMEIASLVGKHPTLFPDRLICELEQSERSSPLSLLGAAKVLRGDHGKLKNEDLERVWNALPALRKNKSAAVRYGALSLVFVFRKSKDVFPLFFDSLDDMEKIEGTPDPVALYAITGITASRKCSPEVIAKLLSFLDSAHTGMRRLAAMELPRIVSGDETQRTAVIKAYAERLEKNEGPVVLLAGCFGDLQPPPRSAAATLLRAYQSKGSTAELKIATIASLHKIKGIQPFVEGFLCDQLEKEKNDNVQLAIVFDFFRRCDRLAPRTLAVLKRTRETSNEPLTLFTIDEILRKVEAGK